jgi:hypothetical protein
MELRTMWDRYKNRGLVIFGSLALVLVPMIGYFSAQATQPKQVTFSLDGDIRTVATKADTVEEFLTERNIAVTKKDSLQPTPQTELSNGAVITLHTVWSIPVQIDGQTKVIETLSRDVAGALRRKRPGETGFDSSSYEGIIHPGEACDGEDGPGGRARHLSGDPQERSLFNKGEDPRIAKRARR